MNTEFEPLPWADDFADWLRHRNEPESLKAIAYSAIDSFRAIATLIVTETVPPVQMAGCSARTFTEAEVTLRKRTT